MNNLKDTTAAVYDYAIKNSMAVNDALKRIHRMSKAAKEALGVGDLSEVRVYKKGNLSKVSALLRGGGML